MRQTGLPVIPFCVNLDDNSCNRHFSLFTIFFIPMKAQLAQFSSVQLSSVSSVRLGEQIHLLTKYRPFNNIWNFIGVSDNFGRGPFITNLLDRVMHIKTVLLPQCYLTQQFRFNLISQKILSDEEASSLARLGPSCGIGIYRLKQLFQI